MSLKLKNLIAYAFAFFFVLYLPCQTRSAQDHVVSTQGLHQALVRSSATRQNNISKIEKFFSSQPAQAALKKTKLNMKQVQQAIPALSNQELAQLARQTDKIQNDFAAGALTNQQLTYIIIALATAVIVILIVKA
ncbi:MAG TPA: PA2779 family protein [Terriglobia bacterium]|nr:PA2779 family protein [Terriglobia bacterium]